MLNSKTWGISNEEFASAPDQAERRVFLRRSADLRKVAIIMKQIVYNPLRGAYFKSSDLTSQASSYPYCKIVA